MCPSLRYLQEFTALGTAGGIYHFRDQIRCGNTESFFVLNGDVCADFPLVEMLRFHQGKGDKALVSFIFSVFALETLTLAQINQFLKETNMLQMLTTNTFML